MEAQNSRIAIKLLPSLTDFAFLMPISYLFGRMDGLRNLLSDCDTGWHIRTGQWIVNNHTVPLHDLFSYSKPDGIWYAWEWLSDLIFSGLNAVGGLAAIGLSAILIISAAFTVLFRLARRKSNNGIVAIGVTALAVAASSIHWLARPHLFTLLFSVLFYFALERVRDGRTIYLWILPAATALWTNLHGGFIAGVVWIGAYAAGEALRAVLDPDAAERTNAWIRSKRYGLCAAASLVATLANPYTYHLHVHVYQYLRDPYLSQHIAEFLSIDFHHPVALFFEAMLALSAGAVAWSFRRRSYVEAALIIVWAHGALLSARNIPIFTIAAAPPIAAMISEWLAALPLSNVAGWLKAAARKFNAIAGRMGETDAIPRWHVVSAAGMALVVALVLAPHPPKKFRAEFDAKSFPVGAASKISSDVLGQSATARIFTSDQWGDYLIYRLYPRTRVFIDGRSDYYGDDFERKYVDALNVNYGWDATLARFGVDTVLLPPSSPLSGALKLSDRWRVIYDDGVAIVFRRAASVGVIKDSVVASRGSSRDREVTKTIAGGPSAARTKSKT